MAILVLAEHDNDSLKPSTLHTVTAAKKIEEKIGEAEVHVLVMGEKVEAVAKASAHIDGVSKVFLADAPHLAAQTAEALALQTGQHLNASNYSHILAPATTFGKNLAPRIAAQLDVPQVSGISMILDAHTFVRPIYAGNALATVQCEAKGVVVLTVLSTSFDAAGTTDTSAAIEPVNKVVPDT
ncbi:MAG: electron transfer flavoprotein subunit alpha/FixB family protein, partial [Verrucomicrobia bacterium]|nr:electron transfer flavoprotein subunit alpha/FixB family protein [Verrucomicrobiota bacterium]